MAIGNLPVYGRRLYGRVSSRFTSRENYLLQILLFLPLIVLTGCLGSGPEASSSPGSNSPSDPLYKYAWHLENTGQKNFAGNGGTAGIDIDAKDAIARGTKGLGVTVAISDSGIEIAHEDLNSNYSSGISKNFLLASPYNGDPVYSSSTDDGHGTAVAGLIAAEGWNDIGSRGVAPIAKFGGFNFLATGVVQDITKTLYQMTGSFDVFNYSYGTGACFYREIGGNSTERTAILNAYADGTTTLRGGKGAIYVKSAGNDFDADYSSHGDICTSVYNVLPMWESAFVGNSAMLEENNYPYMIVAGAINANGSKASYSNPGSNLWVAAPGGEFGDSDPAIMTTDITGCSSGIAQTNNSTNDFENGHALNSNCNYTSSMNGTSSAAPIISGVVALMLEANPSLTWRDVKHILAYTAKINDPYTGTYTHPLGSNLTGHTYQNRWVTNAAGYPFHNHYGFGLVDATAAVTMASNYNVNLGSMKDTIEAHSNEWLYTSGGLSLTIPNNSSVGVSSSLSVLHNYVVESVQIRVSANHSYAENLGVELTSPSGTKSILLNINSGTLDENFDDVILLSNAFYGEMSSGNWTLKIVDGSNINPDGTTGTAGVLTNWKINIIGHAPVSPSDSTPPSALTGLSGAAIDPFLHKSPSFSWNPSGAPDLLRYEYSIGTVASGTQVRTWSPISSGASAFTALNLNLTSGTTYYFNLRAVDTSENLSTIVSSSWVAGPILPLGLGVSHTGVIDAFGVLKTWGYNAVGQLGDGSTTDRLTPTAIGTFTNGVYVDSNEFHTCGINTSGALSCWGRNSSGQLGNGNTVNSSSPISVDTGEIYRQISPGYDHTCGLADSGNIRCWGRNVNGQIGIGTIADVNYLTPQVVTSSDKFTFVANHTNTNCGITIEGKLFCWGLNDTGQIGDGSTTNRSLPTAVDSANRYSVVAIGGGHGCGITTSGVLRCWGTNSSGQVGDGTTTNRLTPVTIDSGNKYLTISLGQVHSCGITTSNEIKCWGSNSFGMIGDNTTTNRPSPTSLLPLESFLQVETSGYHTCGITNAGQLKCWGRNDKGQIGDGTTTNRLVPVAITVN